MPTYYYPAQTFKSNADPEVLGAPTTSYEEALDIAVTPWKEDKGLLPGIVMTTRGDLAAGDRITNGRVLFRTESA